jgi:hypothetical protein
MVPDFSRLFDKLKILGLIAVVGAVIFVIGMIDGPEGGTGAALLILGVLAIMPAFLLAFCMTILHWKHRYIGQHSTLWGVLLLLETSGWFKIVYLFRHILPDLRSTGRYTKQNNFRFEVRH